VSAVAAALVSRENPGRLGALWTAGRAQPAPVTKAAPVGSAPVLGEATQ
jgi:hypothetical protein